MPDYAFSDYLQFVLSGLSTGSIYALVALGIVIIYSVTGIINLAQGEYTMLGAMFAVIFYGWGFPLLLAFVASILVVVFIGLVIERLTVNPVRTASPVTLIIITVGVSIIVRGVALLIWGATPYSLPEFTPGAPLNILDAVVSRQRLWIVAATVMVLGLLYYLLERTLLGKALRACSINQLAASFMGIGAGQMSLFAFGLSAGLGAVAGIVIAPLTLVSYNMGLMLGLKGFVAAVIGGLVSAPGAVIGGLLLGVLESLSAGLISSGMKDAIAFLALFVVLLWRAEQVTPCLRLLLRRWTGAPG
ncbi:MAG TPA: branched-chain amino acid ABC transporter permease [Anaerolineae bacterium]|nr:branched-chain amino acid ABC transporter permease [Anaerolineae bacterium]